MQHLPLDQDDDDLLVEIAEKLENDQNTDPNPQTVATYNLTNNVNNANMLLYIIPKVFFPNSNVTINYNFK